MISPSFFSDFFLRLKEIAEEGIFSYYIYDKERKISPHFPFAVRLRLKLFSHLFQTWGTGRTLDEATGKATLELIERLSFFHSTPLHYQRFNSLFSSHQIFYKEIASIDPKYLIPSNTNGMAIHKNKRLAKNSAINELIERHVILRSIALNISPLKVNYTPDYIIPNHVRLSFYIWEGPLKKTVSVCQIEINKKGSYYTSAASDSPKESLKKSFFEAVPLILYSLDEIEENKEESVIIKNDLYSFNRYHRFSGDFSAKFFLEKSNPKNQIDMNINFSEFYFSECSFPQILGKIPFDCVRVISPSIQQLFFDNWDRKYLNPQLKWHDELPTFPHIIS